MRDVVAELVAANVPDERGTGRDPHAEPWERRILLKEHLDGALQRERGPRGGERVTRLLGGRIPHGHDRVPRELNDRAAAREDDGHHGPEVAIQHEDRLLRRTALDE